MRHPQALGQQQVELIAQPLAPVAEVRALVRESVLEEGLAGEVLEIGVVDPALAHAFIGQSKHVLEQQQADHEAALDAGSALVAVERRDHTVDPRPVDLAGELHQLVPHIDYLVEPGPEQIAFPDRLLLLRPHRVLQCRHRITARWPKESETENARFRGLRPPNLAIQNLLLRRKPIRHQSLRRCSRSTPYDLEKSRSTDDRLWLQCRADDESSDTTTERTLPSMRSAPASYHLSRVLCNGSA